MRFREIGRSVGDRVFESVGRAAGRLQESRPLPVDVLESEDAYLVVFDAPGATQTDVQVRYADGAVEVRIDRFRDFYPDFEMRIPGRGLTLDGRAPLPTDAHVDPTEATATLRENGTLEVELPKTEADGAGSTSDDEAALDVTDDTVTIEAGDSDAGDGEGDDGSIASDGDDGSDASDGDDGSDAGDDDESS